MMKLNLENRAMRANKVIPADRIRALAVLLLVSILLAAPSKQAFAIQLVDPPTIDLASKNVVLDFLETKWAREPENQTLAKQTFTTSTVSSPAVSLSYILNRVQHNEPREALSIARELTQRHPESIDGWLMQTWLTALIDDYERTMIDLRSLKKQLDNQPLLGADKKLNAYQRMGKLIGFLQGPVEPKTNADLLKSTLAFIVDSAQPAEIDAFNESRESVLTKFDELQKSQGEKTKRELEKQKVEDANLAAKLNDQNLTFDQSIQQNTNDVARLRKEGLQLISDLASQIPALERQLSSVSSQIGTLQYDLQLLYNDYAYAVNAPPGQHNSVNYLSNLIRNTEYRLYGLQTDGNSISNQIQNINGQINRARGQYDSQIRNIERETKKLTNSKRRNQIKLGKIAGGPDLAAGKKTAMNSRLMALTNYDELSIELSRQQMLDLCK